MSYIALIIKWDQGMEIGSSNTLTFKCWDMRCLHVTFRPVIYTLSGGFVVGAISQISLARPQTHGAWPQTGGQQPEAVQAPDISWQTGDKIFNSRLFYLHSQWFPLPTLPDNPPMCFQSSGSHSLRSLKLWHHRPSKWKTLGLFVVFSKCSLWSFQVLSSILNQSTKVLHFRKASDPCSKVSAHKKQSLRFCCMLSIIHAHRLEAPFNF